MARPDSAIIVFALGFIKGGKHLLAASLSGRRIFDHITGQKLFRDAGVVYPENDKINNIGTYSSYS